MIASGRRDSAPAAGRRPDGYGRIPGATAWSPVVAEVALTFMFLMIILAPPPRGRRRDSRANRHRPGPDHLIGIPVTNLSVNQREPGPALF